MGIGNVVICRPAGGKNKIDLIVIHILSVCDNQYTHRISIQEVE